MSEIAVALGKPEHCGWCGHMPRVDWFVDPRRSAAGLPDEHFVRCMNGMCGAMGPVRDTDEAAVRDWNVVMTPAIGEWRKRGMKIAGR
jgi:hypothetical protein